MSESTMASTSDVTILGGGLAGLSLALQCRQSVPNCKIAVLERNPHPVPEAAFKVGESTVEVGSYYFEKVLGLEDHIHNQQLPKLGLRFFFGAGDNTAIERRLEVGGKRWPATPSYQLDRGRFENHLAGLCLDRGITFLDGAAVTDVQVGRRRGSHRVLYEHGGEQHALTTRWLVDASSRAALLKRKLGLHKPSPHKANAVWFRVQARIKIDDWTADPHWQQDYGEESERWYSTNHLMGEGYWVWLIPLASGSTSIGIVADDTIHPLSTFNSLEKSFAWLEEHEPQCALKVREHQDKIQDFLAVKHYALECTQVFSAARWGITGEAGYFIDPFYSPGSDFIALANTYLTDLIQRDLTGKPFAFRVFLANRIFRKFFYGTAEVYQDQYKLFGNHQVMPVKILWDYMCYWSLLAFFFLQDRACDPWMYPRHMFQLKRMGDMNRFMQGFFRQWHQQRPPREVSGMVNLANVPLIPDTNERLSDRLGRRAFRRRFAENVAQLETLFWEIIDHADVDSEVPFRRRHHAGAVQHAFRHVFEVTAEVEPAARDETAGAVH